MAYSALWYQVRTPFVKLSQVAYTQRRSRCRPTWPSPCDLLGLPPDASRRPSTDRRAECAYVRRGQDHPGLRVCCFRHRRRSVSFGDFLQSIPCLGCRVAERLLLVRFRISLDIVLRTKSWQCWCPDCCRHHSWYRRVAIDLGVASTLAFPRHFLTAVHHHFAVCSGVTSLAGLSRPSR